MSGESVNYIVLAIPVFFLLIGVELLAVCVSRRDYYRLNDALNDLSCGILDQLLEIFMKTVLFAGYVFVFERLRLATLPAQEWWLWAACFLGVDFLYYWFHRLSHEVNAFWAAHVVHHQSEEYNLAVALRQGALQSWFSWIFYVPLALLGFPPLVFLACTSFNTLYQFWIHTRLIGRLGPLEWLLNTPSNHRVHHGRNPKYIDRNHGGTLIVWDRLFGSYQAEQDEPVYGITRPLLSFNPLWANVHYWAELFGLAARTRRPADRLRVFVKPPGWRPQDLGGYQSAPEVDRASYRKWDVWTPPVVRLYAAGQFAIALLAAAVLLNLQDRLASPVLVAGSLLVVAALVAVGAFLEGRAWAPWFEAARLLVSVACATGFVLSGAPVLGALAGAR